MSIQNFLLSMVLRWQKNSSLKLSAEHRFRRNRKWLAAVRVKTKASITVRSDRIAGVPIEWVMPSALASAPQAPVCVYFHGGGFGMGGPNSHRAMAAYLAEKAQIKMLMVDYRLAPEHPFPAALDDALAVYQALLSDSHCPRPLFIGGDSAGGNIALATLQAVRNLPQPPQPEAQPGARPEAQPSAQPLGIFLLSPWLDLTHRNPSMMGNDKTDVMLNRQILDEFRDRYAPGVPATDPRLSPLFGPVDGLPPCMILASQAEALYDDSVKLHQKILDQGGSSALLAWPKLPHAFPVMAGPLPEARQALDQLAIWIQQRTQ
jgi:acetyl esterase/lipase